MGVVGGCGRGDCKGGRGMLLEAMKEEEGGGGNYGGVRWR